jgi:apolipoprotein N-acyltransferase
LNPIANWLITRLQQPFGIWWAIGWLVLFHSLAFMPYIGIEAVHISAGPTAIWAMIGAAPLLFVAYTERFSNIGHKPKARLMPRVYLALLLWNIVTTWWIWNSTAEGATAAFVLNALFQCSPWWVFRFLQRRTCAEYTLVGFACAQVLFEYGHANWDLSWSWLNLGNSLAFNLSMAQWYSVTGALGGSLWLWLGNGIIAYALLVKAGLVNPQLSPRRFSTFALVWIPVPMLISVLLYFQNGTNPDLPAAEVLVVQPNVDPYTEKYTGGYEGARNQVALMCQQSEAKITAQTRFVLWPETSIPYPIMIDEDHTEQADIVRLLRQWLARYPHIQLVAGINTYKHLPEGTLGPDGKPAEPDVFNTALHLSAKGPAELYHKSKLVPGVEQLPYPQVLNMLGSLAIDLGGTVGSLGKQPNRAVFADTSLAPGVAVSPVICYESIYGDFCSGFTRSGGTYIGIITNDAWWGRTNGHRQHLAFASLRAIESRRMIARSANTGISGFINERGDLLDHSAYDERTVLVGQVRQHPATDLTLYARFGDWVLWLALGVLGLVLVGVFSQKKSIQAG